MRLIKAAREAVSRNRLAIAVCLCLGGLLYLRRPDAFYNPQFFAEDGIILFREAHAYGFASLLVPYSGYYHTFSRLAALAGELFPLAYVPVWFNTAALLVTGYVAVRILSPRIPLNHSTKVMLVVALVASPVRNEIYMTLISVYWLLSFVLLLLLISREPASFAEVATDSFELLMVGLTGPFAVIYLPLFGWRFFTRRTRFNAWSLMLAGLAAGIQGWSLLGRALTASSSSAVLGRLEALRIVAEKFIYVFFGDWPAQSSWIFAALLVVLLAMCGLMVFDFLTDRHREALTIMAGGILALLVTVWATGFDPFELADFTRYYYIPVVTLLWGLILWRKYRPRLAYTLLGLSALVTATHYPATPFVDYHWPEASRCIDAQAECLISINPPGSYLKIGPARMPDVQTRWPAVFGDRIELYGYDAEYDSARLRTKFVWVGLRRMDTAYKFFVHLYDPADESKVIRQVDAGPRQFSYPTSQWLVGDIVTDEVELPLEDVRPGQYRVAVGWYNPLLPHMDRLSAVDEAGNRWKDDRVVLPLLVDVSR